MALIEVVDRGALGIFNAIVDALKEFGFDLRKMSNMASDGASVVAGNRTGVCKRLFGVSVVFLQ
jgi:hypothetical protein